jgi:PAS domain S-box-containing protein
MDGRQVDPALVSIEEAAEAVVAALANHGPVGVYAAGIGRADRRLVAGDDLLVGGLADDAIVEVRRSGREDSLLLVAPDAPASTRQLAVTALIAASDAAAAQAVLDRTHRRLAEGERIGRIGSFDWDLIRDELVPSDELLRVFGLSPEDRSPAAGSFLERIHPDDRATVEDGLARSRATGAPLETEVRVLHPDGEERTVWTHGEVALGHDGTPVRLTGVSRDVTEQRRYEREAHAAATRFESLVAAAPDAIIVVGTDGRISAVNPQAGHLLGHDTDALVGLDVDELLPDAVRPRHATLRQGYMADAHPRPMGAGLDLEAKRADGTLVPVDIGLTPIETDEGPAVAAFVRDATPRREAESDRQRFAEGRLRRRQALELNDTVVQGLVALLWRLEDGEAAEARHIATTTLAAARRIMADLLSDDLEDLDRQHLVRSEHASTAVPPTVPAPAAPTTPTEATSAHVRTVLIADDAADLRYLLRFRLERGGVRVVGEAADGQRAIDLALEHRPDVVLLDLSMPVLDGLAAAKRIREALPDVTIVVLSGYPDEVMGDRALSAGADAYCEKTVTLDEVYEAVTGAPASSRR